MSEKFRAAVTDAGGGYVTLFVDRDTMRYPKVGSKVAVFYEEEGVLRENARLRAAFHWIADLPEEDDYPDTLWGRFWEKYRELFPEEMAEKKTPEEWAEAKGIVIVDPDGWRGDGDPALDTAITEAEFDRRAAESTIANRKKDGSW